MLSRLFEIYSNLKINLFLIFIFLITTLHILDIFVFDTPT